MAEERVQRRLAAILAADVVGYSRLTEIDEEGTIARLKQLRRELIAPLIDEYRGRMVKLMGDGALVEFASAVDAVRCAIETQRQVGARNAAAPADQRIEFRIGVNLGDIVIDGDDILGDGVNIAARLEALAEPGGVCLSGAVYEHVRDKVDAAFEDLGAQSVKNIARPVRIYRLQTDAAAPRGPAAARALPTPPDKPSIAVLPFDNMSADPEQDYFSDGITEDLITNLSKIPGLFVIARNSTFAYKGQPTDARRIAGDLGVRFVLEGSVRKAGNQVRITAQLIDPGTGFHLWAERYDRKLTDIFALQDEITTQIAQALELRLTERDQANAARRYTDSLEAYDFFLRGREQFLATNDTNAQAQALFRRAIELDPGFAAAYAILSYTLYRDWFNQWTDDPQRLQQAFDAADTAVALDGSLPLARAYLAWAFLSKKQHDQAIKEAQRAIALDANLAEGHARLGEILNMSGRPDEGIALLTDAMRLDPHYPAHYTLFLGDAHFLLGQYEEAIATFRRCLTRGPNFLAPHRTLAVIFNQLGRTEEAAAQIAEVLRISPRATVRSQEERIFFQDPGLCARYLDGLRQAGLPE